MFLMIKLILTNLLYAIFVIFIVQVMTTHLLHYTADGMLQRFGPVHSTWMYAYERFNSWMGRRAMNRCFPEATIMATYRVCCVLQTSAWAYSNKMVILFCSF